jgi:AbrB family looped-hinge helix DNA binding protein
MRAILTIDRRGAVTLPPELRQALGLTANDPLIAETWPDGVLLRPVVTPPIEVFTDERIREFEEGEAELAAFFARLDAKR